MAGRETNPPLTSEERAWIRGIEQRAAVRAAAILRAEEDRRLREIRGAGHHVGQQPARAR